MNKILSSAAIKIKPECKEKIKRSSKICSALKIRFLEMLQDEGTTIKYAAKHLGINYSTAKVIAKQNKHLLKDKTTSYSDYEEEYLPSREKKPQIVRKEAPRSSYKSIDSEVEADFALLNRARAIQIVSTVAWNFLEQGLPQLLPIKNQKMSETL